MKTAAKIILQAFGTFVVLATALPLLDAQQWYVRVFDYPRMQLFVMALAVTKSTRIPKPHRPRSNLPRPKNSRRPG
jgi:endonuclease/exonuclease/phosphatase (EEP) superfamily protein YafD